MEARHAGRHAPLRKRHHQIVIVGGGAGGIAAAASLLRRRPSLDIAIIEPRDEHFYQPGWTLVGGGVFDKSQTRRPMRDVIPTGANWIQQGVAGFLPEENEVVLDNGEHVSYDVLVAAPGLKLDWAAVKGLPETLGRNGVTSNYGYGLAPYTFELVQELRGGKALFTQPPMPIKCAGAPQKAMYLSCDYWMRHGRLGDIDVEFCNAGGVLFGVAAYVPALMEYVQKYGIDLSFNHNLVAIDGDAKVATFKVVDGDETREVQKPFDMIHVVPPQTAPDFIKASPLAGEGGWIDVDQGTLRHKKYANVWGLGDGTSTPNAKTAAAVRKQAPVVAENVIAHLDGREPGVCYDGYGSCPLTVERGKIVLAEFAYGGKLVPSFPKWFIDGTRPSRLAWLLKERTLPWMYWRLMFRGHEPLARPQPCAKVAAE
ncbi:MAG: NAD(P)/FAD-dependent oxidoreductase [Alphaproteobacteria bacterium]|nr:MAG: NAD(P)/FAD-dependent oxidoreductase [Alphaproteobacteria bacterium]